LYNGADIGVTEEQQAANLRGMYAQLDSLIKVGVWFYLIDGSLPFGLIRADQTPRPAWCAFIEKDWRSVPGCRSRTAAYPYGIATVETSPQSFPDPGLKDLDALFDGQVAPPNYAIINYAPGPVTITLTFQEPATLAGFTAASAGWAGYPSGYRWTVEADAAGTGAFKPVVPSLLSDIGTVDIRFAAPTTARVFRVIHARSPRAGDEVEHILELTPIFAGS
jgi:hypothetical protein